MIGLGLSIDYALFVVTRFREELDAGHDVEAALRRTMSTAGRTVAVSGLTVGIAILSLLLFPVMFLRSMAYGGTAVVAVAMIAALTALPATLAVLGHRVNKLRIPRWRGSGRRGDRAPRLVPAGAQRDAPPGAVRRGADAALGDPRAAVPAGRVRRRRPPGAARGRRDRVVTETVQREFPGFSGSELVAAVEFDRPVTDPAVQRELTAYVQRLGQAEGVDGARLAGADGQVAAVSVHLRTTPRTWPPATWSKRSGRCRHPPVRKC